MNNENNPTTPAGALSVDDLLDAAQEAILSAKDVFISPRNRQLAAKLRRDLWGEPEPEVNFRDEETQPSISRAIRDAGDNYERTAYFALNVMVGLVHRRLAELGVRPTDDEALTLVSRWVVEMTAGTDEEAQILSSMHLAIRARPFLAVPEPASASTEGRMNPAQWRSILAMLARVAPRQRAHNG